MPLPALEVNTTPWNIHAFLSLIHAIFDGHFSGGGTQFLTQPVQLKRSPLRTIDWVWYDCTFHHIVTKDNPTTNSREYDQPRAERIRYPKHYIDDSATYNLWVRRKGNEHRYYISDTAFNYLVVLGKRGNYTVLISAFPIDSNWYRAKMIREHAVYRIV